MQEQQPVEHTAGKTSLTTSEHIPEYCKVIRYTDASGRIKEMVFPKGLDLDRPKRPRTVFSGEQLIKLENVFRKTQYVVGKERHRLSKLLGLTDQQVKVWFQNRRTKLRKGKVDSVAGNVSCEVQSRESIEVNLLKLSEAERAKCASGRLFPEANFTALSLPFMTSQSIDSIFLPALGTLALR